MRPTQPLRKELGPGLGVPVPACGQGGHLRPPSRQLTSVLVCLPTQVTRESGVCLLAPRIRARPRPPAKVNRQRSNMALGAPLPKPLSSTQCRAAGGHQAQGGQSQAH